MANARTVDKPWTHIEVEHAQNSSTTNFYPTNIGVVGHVSEVRKSMVWRWGEVESLFWGSRLSSFRGNVLLG